MTLRTQVLISIKLSGTDIFIRILFLIILTWSQVCESLLLYSELILVLNIILMSRLCFILA